MANPDDSSNPGQSLDTGTGGFPVDGKRQSYDVGSDVGNEGTKVPWSGGRVNVDSQQRDVSRGTKSTLAAYLSNTTLGKTPSSPSSIKNTYAVNHVDGSDPIPLSLTDTKGYPTLPDRDLGNHSEKFTAGKDLQSRSKADTNLDLRRGRQEGRGVDGNDLLKNVSPVAPPASTVGGKFNPPMNSVNIPQDSPVRQYYGNPNLSNSVIYNRFNPENSEYSTQGTQLNSQQFAKKYELGTSEANRDMSYGRLAQVGSILSTRSSTELGSLDPNYVPDVTSAVLPGLAQLGVSRINREELTAESVISDLTESSISENTLINVASESWGSLNNINDQFSGMSDFGMQLLAVALLVALSVAIAAMSAIFTFGSAPSDVVSKDKLGRPIYGAFEAQQKPSGFSVDRILRSIWSTLGIQSTKNPINLCIPTGALSFFGMNKSQVTSAELAGEAALNGIRSVAQSAGYYAILGRLVGRSFLQIGDAFSALGTAFSGGALAGAAQIFNIVGVLRTSRFVRLLNVFAQIGDRTIEANKEATNESDTDSFGFSQRFTGKIDKLPNTDAHKSRMTNVSGKDVSPLTLAWASYRASDLYIVPSGLNLVLNSTYAKKMGMKQVYNTSIPEAEGGLKERAKEIPADESNRISTDVREYWERQLESEYVPFYIHDVRTNEIVSFHAFLASLSDGYTASYDTQEGFGRVEAIKIYKSTGRKIDFSFYIVSTNKYDFDAMWLKINKLTTLLYPQFTEGRTLTDSQNKIYMPFSQTIQASPMVRIRIGDLIASNYSKFNLSRIFGYTYADTQFGGKTRPSTEEKQNTSKEFYKQKLDELKSRPGSLFTTSVMLSSYVPTNETSASASIPGSSTPRSPTTGLLLPRGLALQVVKVREDKPESKLIECKVVKASGVDVEGVPRRELSEIDNRYGNSQNPSSHILNNGYNYVFYSHELTPLPSTKDKISEESSSSGDYSIKVNEFMIDDDPSKGNAIARSFRSSGGKGLAGFIESMSFDWYERVTWTTDEGNGRKAPKMCKVTIGFSPVHDITPGLDHMGSNRAPIYPIKGLDDR